MLGCGLETGGLAGSAVKCKRLVILMISVQIRRKIEK